MRELKKRFQYKPLSLREILREMKQNIDLMIDFAFSAIKFGSKEFADETSKIEERIHELTFLLNFQIIRTQTGGYKEAKKLEPMIVIGHSIDKISDALADIANTVYINNDIIEFTQLFREKITHSILKVTVNQGCEFIEQYRKDVHFRTKYGVDLIAILRNNTFLFGKEEKVRLNDALIVKGEFESILKLKEKTFDKEPISLDLERKEKHSKFNLKDEEVKEYLLYLKKNYNKITTISETMIELALAALIFNNDKIAEDILEMEALVDGLNINFEKDLLNFAQYVEEPRDLTGILRIIFSCELISDAAANIAETVLKGFKIHEIFKKAMVETSEIVVRENISKESYFRGKTYSQLQDSCYKRGFHIIALKRGNKWIYRFKPNFLFRRDDLIIGLGPIETVEQWRKCVNPEKFKEE